MEADISGAVAARLSSNYLAVIRSLSTRPWGEGKKRLAVAYKKENEKEK